MSHAVEVLVSWQGRILSSHGFSRPGRVFIGGGSDADVMVPTLPSWAKYELLQLGAQTRLRLSPLSSSAGEVFLLGDETARVEFEGGLISLIIRNIPRPQNIKMAPILDISQSEKAGIALAFATTTFLGLYMNSFSLPTLPKADEILEKRFPTSKIVFENRDLKSQIKIENATEARQALAGPRSSAPRPTHTHKPMRTTPRNILQTFSTKGIADQLTQAISSGDELNGMVNFEVGHGESESHVAGLKETGSGREGKSILIGGLGTNGRNRGGTGYVGGLGVKGHANVATEGAQAEITGGMDREAIRRVIREHLAEIRSCYERELQQHPDMYGKLVLEWDIEDKGKVSRAMIKSNSLENAVVPECLLTHLKSWKFPDPPSNQIGRVSYPFIFLAH